MEPSARPVSYAPGERISLPRTTPLRKPKDRYWLHALLFVLTLISTTLIGIQWAGRLPVYLASDVWFSLFGGDGAPGLPINGASLTDGLRYSLSLLGFLTVHEFGHYFAARRHRVDTTLPYYIPMPILMVGTLGAVIRIRQSIPSMRKLFDIGAAGPIAGFVVAFGILLFAFATLPPPSYLLDQVGHEELKQFIQMNGRFPDGLPTGSNGGTIVVGNTLLFWTLSQVFANVPPMFEMYHYPMLFAGWLGLFFTALNLLPVGQLDGGHILYALVGPKWHGRIARGFFLLLLLSASMGFVTDIAPMLRAWNPLAGDLSWFLLAAMLYFLLSRAFGGEHRIIAPVLLALVGLAALSQYVGTVQRDFGYFGWFIWCLLIVTVIKVDHPPVLYTEPLTPARRMLALLSIVIFILCFSIKPLYVV